MIFHLSRNEIRVTKRQRERERGEKLFASERKRGKLSLLLEIICHQNVKFKYINKDATVKMLVYEKYPVTKAKRGAMKEEDLTN